MEAHNNADKKTDRSGRAARLLVNLTLVENELAARGPVEVFVRVFDPDGKHLLTEREQASSMKEKFCLRPLHVKLIIREKKSILAFMSTT